MIRGLIKILFFLLAIPYAFISCIRAGRQLSEIIRGIEACSETELLKRVNKRFQKYDRKEYSSLEEFIADLNHIKFNNMTATSVSAMLFMGSILLIIEGIKTWGGIYDLSFTFIAVSFILIPVSYLLLVVERTGRKILDVVATKMELEGRVDNEFILNDPLWYKVLIGFLLILIFILELFLFLDMLDIF